MLAVLWSVDPGDWRRPGVRAIVRSVLSAARPGAIVELHDGGGDRQETVAALPAIVSGLRRRHYRTVTVSRLLSLDPPTRQQRLPHLGAA
jgi:peptidoglycan/xylan/chitin deacetylase (PgdA/CDA1 family)